MDDEAPADGCLDLYNGRVRQLESALEVFPLKKTNAIETKAMPTVFCLRGQSYDRHPVIMYVFRPYDKDGKFIGRVTRCDGEKTTVLSEGYIRKVDLKNVIELNPHPGQRLVPCFFRKQFFFVDMEAWGPSEGRKVNPRVFSIKKYVYPRFTNEPNFARWLKAKEPST